jgi:hypothetical protein
MNQPERAVPDTVAPMQQYKGQLIDKGYSYREIKEKNAVTSIFKFSDPKSITKLDDLPPIINN